MNKAISVKIEEWSQPPFDKETIAQLEVLKQNPDQLEDAFYKDLEFGTGGMRGIMGIGTNRINAYTLGKSTQGLCDYLKSVFEIEVSTDTHLIWNSWDYPRSNIGVNCRIKKAKVN